MHIVACLVSQHLGSRQFTYTVPVGTVRGKKDAISPHRRAVLSNLPVSVEQRVLLKQLGIVKLFFCAIVHLLQLEKKSRALRELILSTMSLGANEKGCLHLARRKM